MKTLSDVGVLHAAPDENCTRRRQDRPPQTHSRRQAWFEGVSAGDLGLPLISASASWASLDAGHHRSKSVPTARCDRPGATARAGRSERRHGGQQQQGEGIRPDIAR